ncbi:probable serine/threonine-protein kinase roco6 [Mytilus edulis]|uniref:probable serine/threonine-protein kinase roco6 n=1 Tax=Mytilus edulis TaxID=6550 RepID=UPI0039EF9D7B
MCVTSFVNLNVPTHKSRDCNPSIICECESQRHTTALYTTRPQQPPTSEFIFKISGLPWEVKKLDKKSARVFSSLLEEESYPHYESRVMLAGEQATGKTTIARYLVGKRPTRFRMSTDGIELYNGLSYMDRDTKDWLGGHQDFSLEEITVSRSMLQKEKTQDKDKDVTSDTGQQDNMYNATSKAGTLELDGTSNKNEHVALGYQTGKQISDFCNDIELDEVTFVKEKPTTDSHYSKTDDADEMLIQTVTKPGAIRKLKNVFGITKKVKEVKVSITKKKFLEKSFKAGQKQLHNKKIAPIIIWDFGGQDVFYSTHQTFLTYRAIYIVVLDGSRKLDDPCPNDQYLPGKSGYKTARDYLLFWINTIVTYCKGSNQGFPKIMVVLTHKDMVNANEVENRRHELFADIRQMFKDTSLTQHLVMDEEIFVNARDKHDQEMWRIKKTIIRESEKQPTWGEPLPKCFIPLELEFASLIRRNIPLITLQHLAKINALQPIRPLSEAELKVFLKFQHSIGKVLYFDEQKLDKHVILSPTHLIDAFKSIVTDRRFCEGDEEREKLWEVLDTKGVVSKMSINTVWMKKIYRRFNENKDYLLDVMTHLDIMVEPKRYDSDRKRVPADFYYVASMVRSVHN